MKMRLLCRMAALFAAILLAAGAAWAQTNSGEIRGRVVDAADAVVVDADVTLTNQATGDTRQMKSDKVGEFVFVALQPGTFTITVVAPNFKIFEKKDLQLSSNERLSAGVFRLEIGSKAETLSVTAEATPIQTESSERSALLDAKEVSSLMSIGRDPMALMRTMPGVVQDGGGAGQLGQTSAGTVSGIRGDNNAISIDGVTGNTRGGATLDSNVNMDAVSEVKVLLNNYQAEYGQSSGAIINMVTKSGTQKFHGTGYYYGRNEAFNANSWMNNYTGADRTKYRYNTIGGNLGGPLYIPKLFNTNKDKLFFFYSREYWPTKTTPDKSTKYRMPTLLERAGDFSQSFDKSNKPIVIKDPTTGKAYDGNVIPKGMINGDMLKIMNLFPLPTINCTNNCPVGGGTTSGGVTSGGGTYNYETWPVKNTPVTQDLLRLDYNLNSKLRMYFRGTKTGNKQNGLESTTGAMPWGFPMYYDTPGLNAGYNLTYVASPTLVNEFQVGYAEWKELTNLVNQSDFSKITRTGMGINIGQQNPAQNPLNVIPNIAGIGTGSTGNGIFALTNVPGINFNNRFPMMDKTGTWEFSDGLTKIWNRHTFKVGAYLQVGRYLQARTGSVFAGSFDFQPNISNINGDSGFAYANMLLGNYYSYTESTNRTDYAPHWHVLEWYAQDSWKAKSNLSLDYGVRFSYDLPTNLAPGFGATFRPELYDNKTVTPLYGRILYSKLNSTQQTLCRGKGTIDAKKGTCAINPNNSADVRPDYFYGSFIGDFNYTGTTLNTDNRYPHSMRDSNGVLFAPRLGVSWDPFKDGKTAIRFGVGVYYNVREGGGTMGDFSNLAPITISQSIRYGNVSTFTANCNTDKDKGCTGYGKLPYGPGLTRILDPHRKVESNVPVQLSIQRNLGFSTVIDVAYVGTFTRHQSIVRDVNKVPYGAQFLAANLDPTQAAYPKTFFNGTVSQQPALVDNFFRPFPGYGEVNSRSYDGTSNYNSLQTTLNRRFTKGLQFGASYTWSKGMSYVDTVNGTAPTYADMRWYAYGKSGTDRTHNLVVHWVYNLPQVSRLTGSTPVLTRFAKAVGDNWEWSGLSQFISGSPQSVTMDVGNLNLSGGGDTARVLVTGDPKVKFDHSSKQYLNPNAFALPGLTATGWSPVTPSSAIANMSRNVAFIGPGVNNWDMALQKNVPITEKLKVTLRVEAFNVFNHVSFTGVDTKVAFDVATTGLPKTGTGQTFGQVNKEREARKLQLSGRITF